MVIVIVGTQRTVPAAFGRTLAAELGWPYVEATHLRPIVARAADRREHLVAGASNVSDREREALHADLRAVRFVYVDDAGAAADGEFSSTIHLPRDTAAPEALALIRREFGA